MEWFLNFRRKKEDAAIEKKLAELEEKKQAEKDKNVNYFNLKTPVLPWKLKINTSGKFMFYVTVIVTLLLQMLAYYNNKQSSEICAFFKWNALLFQEASLRAAQNEKRRRRLEEMRETIHDEGSPLKPSPKPNPSGDISSDNTLEGKSIYLFKRLFLMFIVNGKYENIPILPIGILTFASKSSWEEPN